MNLFLKQQIPNKRGGDMKGIRFFIMVLVVAGFLVPQVTLYAQQSSPLGQQSLNIEYILDASNSMNEALPSGETKIDAAKRVLCNLVDNIAAEAKDVNIGLRIYGAKFDPASTKEIACMDSVLVVPITKIDANLIKQKVMTAKAAGYTPIAYSLELASKDFVIGEGQNNTIVLVSDGIETCGGDPVAVARKLVEQGFGIKIYSIGLAVDAATRKQLEAIAAATGGAYYDAEDADQLQKSLEEIKQRSFEEYEAAGKSVEPSSYISTAPEAEEGEFKWKIGMQELQFYKIKVYKGQTIKASLIVKKTPYDAMNSIINQTFSVKLFNNTFEEVASEDYTVAGNPEEPATFKAQWDADRTGWVYAAVSATNNHDADGNPNSVYPEDLVPEPSDYTLKLKIKGEAPAEEAEVEVDKFVSFSVEDKKGGTGFENADEVKPDTVSNGSIYMTETRFYKLPLGKGAKKVIATAVVTKPWYHAMNSRINMEYILKIYDEDWVEMASNKAAISKNPAKPFSVTAESDVSDNDEVYISLTASKNLEASFYPEDFKPEAQNYSVLITTE